MLKAFVHVLSALLSVFCILVPQINPQYVSWAGFLGFITPLVLLYNLSLFFLLIYKKEWMSIFPLLVFVAGYPSLKATFGFQLLPNTQGHDLELVTFNARLFNANDGLKGKKALKVADLIERTSSIKSDIFCIQEVLEFPGKKDLDLVKKFKEAGLRNVYFSESSKNMNEKKGDRTGMLIASKFPIIKSGWIGSSQKSNNKIIWADIKIKDQLIRVYNMHLISNSLNEKDVDALKIKPDNRTQWSALHRNLKSKFIKRAEQLDGLKKHIQACEHPVILAGDCNEIPYGYVYSTLAKKWDNAHAEAGFGFGFTYNGFLPFLRIDNIFADPSLKVIHCSVLRSVDFSDHFPIKASFKFKN